MARITRIGAAIGAAMHIGAALPLPLAIAMPLPRPRLGGMIGTWVLAAVRSLF